MERIGLDRLIANPLVLLMSHVLWTSFSRAFRLISFILLVARLWGCVVLTSLLNNSGM